MYITLLSAHSIFRWLVVIGVVYTLYRAYAGLGGNKKFTAVDANTRKYTVIAAHIQLLIGLAVYFLSPLTQYFMSNFGAAVKVREMRFYGMEHSIVMVIAIVLITIGSAASKKKETDRAKFKALALWFTIALVLLLLMIPWPISPFSIRPWFRF
ncbi:MAG TPA: hypothetical protein PK605_09865 [Ignavibacteria bacterium]|nr:hypothetical protein [Bacteroidota bacterium]HRE11416.1 hypothetical protein [Ignavibacteria bacterium]HRF65417.1 hypothetical protein [Ignavibacteria bacterium]HRJ04693.1 hypothetical protein [Ignavibacteria bacterium]HRJ84760.1 hypothetical protein [Ignavibacteria bacterium]